MMGIFSGAKIAVLLLLLSVAGGGYLYVKNLQEDVDRLTKNNVLLETAVNSKDQEIDRLNEEIVQVREVNSRVTEESRKLNGEVDVLRNKLSEHDLGYLAENKPGLVQRIINKDIENSLKAGIEELTSESIVESK
jgi:predicted nuclease with TOPRIM domain